MPASHRLCLVLLSLMIALSAGAAHAALEITSPDFAAGQPMPAKYAQAHGNVSPALRLKGVPEAARSLLLIVEDPDAPKPMFTHWLVWNIDPHHALFLEGRPPRGSVVGTNTLGDRHYDGPAPAARKGASLLFPPLRAGSALDPPGRRRPRRRGERDGRPRDHQRQRHGHLSDQLAVAAASDRRIHPGAVR